MFAYLSTVHHVLAQRPLVGSQVMSERRLISELLRAHWTIYVECRPENTQALKGGGVLGSRDPNLKEGEISRSQCQRA